MSLWKSHDVYGMIRDSLDDHFILDECTDDGISYLMNCDFVTDNGSPHLILTILEETRDGEVVNNKFKIKVECVAVDE